MATIYFNGGRDDQGNLLGSWSNMSTGDTGTALKALSWKEKFVQTLGTFGGATITIEGSMDNATWVTCTTDGSTACTFAAAGVKKIYENYAYIRAKVTGGAGNGLYAYIAGTISRG